MTEIAERAAAAREALDALARAVRELPPPAFKFTRSIQLLNQLASWASSSRRDLGFEDATVLSSALQAGLESGSEGRKAPPGKRGPKARDKAEESALFGAPDKPDPANLKEIAKLMAKKGGESRSPAKVAAAKANIKAVNARRWGFNRRKRARKSPSRPKR